MITAIEVKDFAGYRGKKSKDRRTPKKPKFRRCSKVAL
jgi:hypothetical protein